MNEQRVLEKDGTGLDFIIIKMIYCLFLYLHSLSPQGSEGTFSVGIVSSLYLQEASKAWGWGPVFSEAHWPEAEPRFGVQAPNSCGRSAQILSRP